MQYITLSLSVGDFRHLVDVNFVTAMGPPGGGRNPVTARLMRHFNMVSFTELEEDSQFQIFNTILGSWTCKSLHLLCVFALVVESFSHKKLLFV